VFDIAYYHAMKLSEIEENSVLNRTEKGKNICMGKIGAERPQRGTTGKKTDKDVR